MTSVMLAHMYALRAHIDAVIAQMEAEAGVTPESNAGGCLKCGAPADYVSDATTLDGVRKSRCATCGAVWEL